MYTTSGTIFWYSYSLNSDDWLLEKSNHSQSNFDNMWIETGQWQFCPTLPSMVKNNEEEMPCQKLKVRRGSIKWMYSKLSKDLFLLGQPLLPPEPRTTTAASC